jgi:hypothetical protein
LLDLFLLCAEAGNKLQILEKNFRLRAGDSGGSVWLGESDCDGNNSQKLTHALIRNGSASSSKHWVSSVILPWRGES